MTTTANLERDALMPVEKSGDVVPPETGSGATAVPMAEVRWLRAFIHFAGGVLLADGLIRLLCAASQSEFLTASEPLLGIPLRLAVLLVGSIELGVALICLFGRRIELRLALVAWMSTNFVVYWIGLLSLGCHPQWSAIGTLTDPLQIARGHIGAFLRVAPAGLVVGSYGLLLWLWFGRKVLQRRQQAADSLKMFCPSCGGHIKFASTNLGQKSPCPHCQTSITLHKPDEKLKMSCFFCQEHIAFPAHALGTKMPCPHCQKDITLIEPK